MKKIIPLAFIITLIFGSEIFGKDTIYVAEFPIENSNMKQGDLDDFRSTFVRNLVEHGSKDYIIQDDVLGKSLLRRVKKQQLYGSENDADKLSNLASYKFEVEGFIRFDSGKYSLLFKVNSFEQKASLEKVIEKKNISDFQMEYYLNEISLAVLNPSHRINDSGAPMRAAYNINLNPLNLDNSDMEIKKINFNYNDEREKVFAETYKPILEEADTLYAKKKFIEAVQKYENVHNSIYKNNSKDTLQAIKNFSEDIENRIILCYKNDFFSKLSSKKKNAPPEVPANYEQGNLKSKTIKYLYDANAGEIILKLQSIYNAGIEFLNKSSYAEAIEKFEYILHQKKPNYLKSGVYQETTNIDWMGYKGPYTFKIDSLARGKHIFSEEQDYSKHPQIASFLNEVIPKIEKIKQNIQNLSMNNLYARCDAVERSIAHYDVLYTQKKHKGEEGLNTYIIYKQNKMLLEKDQYPQITQAGIQRLEQVKKAAKSSVIEREGETSITASDIRVENEKRDKKNYFRSEFTDNLTLDIILFPFKYVANIAISIVDVFRITPLTGIGVGGETPLIHPNIGWATGPSLGTVQEKKFIKDRDNTDTVYGTIINGYNECKGYLIDYYPLKDFPERWFDCKSGDNSVAKINVWAALIFGLKFQIDLSKTANVIPEMLVLPREKREPFWDFSETDRSPRFDYFYKPVPFEKLLDWKFIEKKKISVFFTEDWVKDANIFLNARECKKIGMTLASDNEAIAIETVSKEQYTNKTICVKEK